MKKTILLTLVFLSCFSFCKAQWYQQNIDIHAIFGLDFLNENTGMLGGIVRVGNNSIGKAFYTTNSGVNWNNSNIPDSSQSFISCVSINDNLSYMGGMYYDSSIGSPFIKPFIVKSTDQGRNWSLLCTIPGPFYYLLDMDFVNENTGYASVQRGHGNIAITSMMNTTNAGQTWTLLLTLDSLSDLYSIDCLNENVVFGIGGNGHGEFDYMSLVVKTADGGAHWESQVFPEMVVADDISFTDDENGLFTGRGDSGYVYRTTNQGSTWMKVLSITNVGQLIHVDFCERTGIALVFGHQEPGVGAFVWKTIDFGGTWNDQHVSFAVNQGPIVGDLVDSVNYYIGTTTPQGVNAKVYHTTTGGSVFVSNPGNIIPSDFRLYQNFPNPFNPSTTIEYSVSNSQLVTIKIFDILGNEVSVLHAGKQNPGTYSVSWDATGKPSGVYFYTLTAGKFSETKKMLVIK